jgi:hypothetical protein
MVLKDVLNEKQGEGVSGDGNFPYWIRIVAIDLRTMTPLRQ